MLKLLDGDPIKKGDKWKNHFACLALQETTLLVLHVKKQRYLSCCTTSLTIQSNVKLFQLVYFHPWSY